jgi:2-keto-4-pentenoate hydratase/2-oxohepta-3-ene-1,7-dioic acid hydratase in catechol pathway
VKLVSFLRNGEPGFGCINGDGVVDFSARVDGRSLREHIERGSAQTDLSADFSLAEVNMLPPIVEPRKILCVGLNYRSHVLEAGHEIPKFPTIFLRTANSQVGHGAPLIRPLISYQYDYEGELAVVIGKGGRHIPAASATRHIAGYTCYNDGSVRDWQRRASQWGPGKNFTASGACGPWLVTVDEIPDPGVLELTTKVNGAVMQRAAISDLIFSVSALIAYCSEFAELESGDLIVTGTPGGVGGARTPPVWLQAGDRVEVSVSGIGTLSNVVEDEDRHCAPRV